MSFGRGFRLFPENFVPLGLLKSPGFRILRRFFLFSELAGSFFAFSFLGLSNFERSNFSPVILGPESF